MSTLQPSEFLLNLGAAEIPRFCLSRTPMLMMLVLTDMLLIMLGIIDTLLIMLVIIDALLIMHVFIDLLLIMPVKTTMVADVTSTLQP